MNLDPALARAAGFGEKFGIAIEKDFFVPDKEIENIARQDKRIPSLKGSSFPQTCRSESTTRLTRRS
jgi:hypothetical protein